MINSEGTQSEAEAHRLIGGALCLDFANTINGHLRDNPNEYLKDYGDLVLWSRKAGLISNVEANSLIQEAIIQPDKATAAYELAITLREIIFRIFSAIALEGTPAPADLEQLNEARADALAHSKIVQIGEGFSLEWTGKAGVERMLWPITLSAADLLTSNNLYQVRQCAGQGCDWLFLDTSRNHLRRWCSMDECGNRAKSRRFMQRKRQSVATRYNGRTSPGKS